MSRETYAWCAAYSQVQHQTDFIELNHPAYSPELVSGDYHLFSNLKNSLRSRNFETDDEVIMTVNHYLDSADSNFFLEA